MKLEITLYPDRTCITYRPSSIKKPAQFCGRTHFYSRSSATIWSTSIVSETLKCLIKIDIQEAKKENRR